MQVQGKKPVEIKLALASLFSSNRLACNFPSVDPIKLSKVVRKKQLLSSINYKLALS